MGAVLQGFGYVELEPRKIRFGATSCRFKVQERTVLDVGVRVQDTEIRVSISHETSLAEFAGCAVDRALCVVEVTSLSWGRWR